MEVKRNLENIDIIILKAPLDRNVEEIVTSLVVALSQQNKTLPFLERVIKILPELDGQIDSKLSQEELYNIVDNVLEKRFLYERELMNEMLYKKRMLIEKEIIPAASEMLELFNVSNLKSCQVKCYLGFFNPFPRKVLKKEYCIHYLSSNDIFVRASLHEINHMILFEKWKSMFGYEEENEPEFPDPLWYLEELSIEPTLNEPRIQQLAPYIHKAYNSFYEIIIDGKSLPEQVMDIYKKSSSIEEYLVKAFKYIEEHITI